MLALAERAGLVVSDVSMALKARSQHRLIISQSRAISQGIDAAETQPVANLKRLVVLLEREL